MIRRSGLSKTADFGSRLILSAPELKVETVDEMIDIKHAEVPLASVCANFEPYMIYHSFHDKLLNQHLSLYEHMIFRILIIPTIQLTVLKILLNQFFF
jgi:hypothetical protein